MSARTQFGSCAVLVVVEYLLIELVHSGYVGRANKGTVARRAIQFVSSRSDVAVTGAVGSRSILFEEIEVF